MTHLAREIPQQDYGRHTKRFGQKEIRRAENETVGFKAVVERLEEVGFYNIERDIKLENLEEIDEETWNEKKNGILLLHRLWKLHGAPNLANTISALTELLNIETTMHQDPAPNLPSERILTEFFPGTPDNMKIALLMRTVNTDKYRSILDSMKIPGMVIPTYLELKQSRTTMRQIAPSTSKMKGGKRKAPGGKSHTKAEDLASCRFGKLSPPRITSANRPQAVITCTTISRNLLALVQLAANGRDVSLSRLELYDNRGNTYPIKIVDNFFVEVAPPLDFDMTIDTTFHQSPAAAYAIHALEGLRLRRLRLAHFNETKIKASIAAGAKFGEHKTSADTATKKLTHLCEAR
ncbi:hypothetical protein RI054_32g126240 [Pseudoscourfieldia marina]